MIQLLSTQRNMTNKGDMLFMIRMDEKLIVVLILALSINGCVNLKAVSKFSEGAKKLSDASGKFYDMQLETDRQDAAISVNLGNGVLCDQEIPWECTTKKGTDLIEPARIKHAAVESLAAYANGLNEISTAKNKKNIKKAATELGNNLDSIAKTLEIAAPVKGSILASAISELGGMYVDVKSKRVIYEAVEQSQNDVDVIINALVEDTETQMDTLKRSRVRDHSKRGRWFDAFRGRYGESNSGSEKAYLSIAAGKLVSDDIKDELAYEPSQQFLKQLTKTAAECRQAHRAIGDPTLSDKAEVITDFVNHAQVLLNIAKQLNN